MRNTRFAVEPNQVISFIHANVKIPAHENRSRDLIPLIPKRNAELYFTRRSRRLSLTPEKELYERLIAELREEVSFLRGLLKK